uniref:Zerknuellt 5 n=1 Tax=Episyrphus balteatus TaxID=286459 RepID=B5M6Y5_EPIBA|nr:zerknuellt 5 [Episyrphus balteatus]
MEQAKNSKGTKNQRIKTAFTDFQIIELEKEDRKIDISKTLPFKVGFKIIG